MPMTDSKSELSASRTGRWRFALQRERTAPARARREIAGLGLVPANAGDLQLLVSEVVTNAVRHGGADDDAHVIVEVVAERRCICVRVLDGGRRVPAPREPGEQGGFGLHLVEALAARWGAAPGEVWFELPGTA